MSRYNNRNFFFEYSEKNPQSKKYQSCVLSSYSIHWRQLILIEKNTPKKDPKKNLQLNSLLKNSI